jgi:hypothetical protein
MSESFIKKADGKDKIIRALGALLILFSAFIFFNTINPELLKVRFKPFKFSGASGGEYLAPPSSGAP